MVLVSAHSHIDTETAGAEDLVARNKLRVTTQPNEKSTLFATKPKGVRTIFGLIIRINAGLPYPCL